jgi:hypothetical protein
MAIWNIFFKNYIHQMKLRFMGFTQKSYKVKFNEHAFYF